ncbi:unnamed protein product, partial [Meganyctiphanes norvegica]
MPSTVPSPSCIEQTARYTPLKHQVLLQHTILGRMMMFLPNTVNHYMVVGPSIVLLCTVVTSMLLWRLQCSGLSTDLDILNIHSLATIQSGSPSITFDKLPQNDSLTYDTIEKLEA